MHLTLLDLFPVVLDVSSASTSMSMWGLANQHQHAKHAELGKFIGLPSFSLWTSKWVTASQRKVFVVS
jgi:hypothetical protein